MPLHAVPKLSYDRGWIWRVKNRAASDNHVSASLGTGIDRCADADTTVDFDIEGRVLGTQVLNLCVALVVVRDKGGAAECVGGAIQN